MELVYWLIDLFLHLDKHLAEVIQAYGTFTYVLLFFIIFMETGLVVTPVLPGDSLLFAAGTFAAMGALNVHLVFLLVSIAAIAGDTVNYWIGHYAGPKVFTKQKSRFFNPEHLRRTHAFYERYGGKTIILARFIPIIRTFAPFVAGIGAMSYGRFILYNAVGGILWPFLCLYAGYFFGNIPVVKDHFSLVIMAIVFISVLPGIIEFLRHRTASERPRSPSS
ncbi:MAG: DedA family protein [Thermodesulfobacteriota bacterium]